MKIYAYFLILLLSLNLSAQEFSDIEFSAGHISLAQWILPDQAPYPEDNKPNKARVELGKALFFEPRLSRNADMSCASCHNPLLGWSDGLPTSKGSKGHMLSRAAPTIINTAFNSFQMWDGHKATLEEQAMIPLQTSEEMNADMDRVFLWLNSNSGYKQLFEKAYPGEAIGEKTFSKALASFERTLISNNSRFDQWIKGDTNALTAAEVEGFKVFVNPNKGNCAVCHSGNNFTDDGFHNVGLKSFGTKKPDLGRYNYVPLRLMKGAFKTPTVRDIGYSAPYFHDGSAKTLREVIDFYERGGDVKTNLSPNMKALTLTEKDKENLELFLLSLSSPVKAQVLPVLP